MLTCADVALTYFITWKKDYVMTYRTTECKPHVEHGFSDIKGCLVSICLAIKWGGPLLCSMWLTNLARALTCHRSWLGCIVNEVWYPMLLALYDWWCSHCHVDDDYWVTFHYWKLMPNFFAGESDAKFVFSTSILIFRCWETSTMSNSSNFASQRLDK